MDTRFLDDLTPGQRFTSPGLTLTEAEIIDFAWRYDPQPFHLDANAAASSPYGGLIASGFQSLAICFRLFIQSGLLAESSMGSPGLMNCAGWPPSDRAIRCTARLRCSRSGHPLQSRIAALHGSNITPSTSAARPC